MPSELVVCPDCGKYIAPEGSVDATARCRCAEEAEAARAFAQAAAPAPKAKSCYVCGTELTGQRRLKDHLNRYWCLDCARADERAKQKAVDNQCPGCSRMFAPSKLFAYNDEKLCRTCYKQRMEETAKRLRKLGHETAIKRHDLNAIKGLLIALGVMVVLAILNALFGPFF